MPHAFANVELEIHAKLANPDQIIQRLRAEDKSISAALVPTGTLAIRSIERISKGRTRAPLGSKSARIYFGHYPQSRSYAIILRPHEPLVYTFGHADCDITMEKSEVTTSRIRHADIWVLPGGGTCFIHNRSIGSFSLQDCAVEDGTKSTFGEHVTIEAPAGGKYILSFGEGFEWILHTFDSTRVGQCTQRMARLPSPDRTPAPQLSAPTSASRPRTNLLTYNLWKMGTKNSWLYVNDHSVVMKKSANAKVFVQKISRAYEWDPSMRNERSILQQLDHKHVVKLFLDRPGSQPPTDNLDLEFINGSDLGSRLRTVEGYCKLEIAPLIQLLRTLPEVIQYLVKQKAEHNDLKPENILMTRKGIKVVDFELAKIGEDRADPVDAGSPGYVPPELMRGSGPIQWPGKRDVYAFGIICLFALRLIKLPKPDLFTISKIDVDGPDREKMDEWLGHISTIKTELPHNLELIERTLTRHPNERVDSTELVAKDYSFIRSHLRGVIDKALKLRSKNKTHVSGGDSEEV